MLSDGLRRDADRALAGLAASHWVPKSVLVHDDLWKGNILLPRGSNARRAARRGFFLIDWAGSQVDGFAFWDFARLCESLACPSSLARRSLRTHCEALGCDASDAVFHLLAALADLRTRLEHMPPERFAAAAERARGLLGRVLAS